jgi:hypothetical protein
MWLIDIRHWLNDNYDGPALPRLKLKVAKLKEIIIYATSELAGRTVESAPRCWRKPQRKPCEGILKVRVVGHDEIRWFCPACSDEGVISGWTGLIWDMSFNSNGTTH